MRHDLIPTKKEINIFWSGISASAITSLIGAFFVASFFYLATEYFNYGFWFYLFVLLNSGLVLLIIVVYARTRITPIKRDDIIYK